MSRHLMLQIPDGTKAIAISIVAEQKDGGLALKTKGIDTKQILEGRDVEIEIDEEDTE
ncbi:hypothetical protein WQ1_01424 [Enterococcus faecium EnGen0371]|uniref:hypothetical protein n=1 Tax=Enterococcus faecium TaxID=1352 RepID=UPI00032E0FB6|nr:hypothetical protein [Enterococcus faecium]EOK16938.1 hypothetical protein WQ1_01424 [Enterococcus faecium EnGen0371]EOM46115.1 hypothetical protein SKW_01128 [Enterococcus faecium EnGen0174]